MISSIAILVKKTAIDLINDCWNMKSINPAMIGIASGIETAKIHEMIKIILSLDNFFMISHLFFYVLVGKIEFGDVFDYLFL